MKVIVGLGNPGQGVRAHASQRRLVGRRPPRRRLAFRRLEEGRRGARRNGTVGGIKVRLIKPLTYMNLSGGVLRPYLRRPFWSAATDLMIVVDEVALPLGRYRFRAKGSAGGHNGLKSIEAAVQVAGIFAAAHRHRAGRSGAPRRAHGLRARRIWKARSGGRSRPVSRRSPKRWSCGSERHRPGDESSSPATPRHSRRASTDTTITLLHETQA